MVPAHAELPLRFMVGSLAESLTEVSGWSKRRISAAFRISSQVGCLSAHGGGLKSAAFEVKLEKLVHFALT
jgi:hypothetical protein